MNYFVIFGGQDPEEQAARELCAQLGVATAVATLDGVPVHAGNAYKANGCQITVGELDGVESAVIFECSPAAAGEREVVLRCDHHNPGDPGFGGTPANFWLSSSLGQLASFFGVEPTSEMLLVAAGDHCPAAAYRGECPGIDPELFAQFRVEGKFAFYASNPRTAAKADRAAIEVAIANAVAILEAAESVEGLKDLRSLGIVEELPEAALKTGHAYMAQIRETDRDLNLTGKLKIVLGGHTTEEMVRAFMVWANELPNKVGNAYGDPVRGFAGVVVTPDSKE